MMLPLHAPMVLLRALGRLIPSRLAFWLVLAIALGIGLGQAPLFGVLGFELALVAAAFGAIMGLDVGGSCARAIARAPAPGVTRAVSAVALVVRTTLRAVAIAVAIVLVPAVICAIRGAWTPTCDWWFGIRAYAAMPVASAALGAALGHAIGIACGPRRVIGTLATQVPTALLLAWGIWRFLAAPPVFSYDALVGFFPGNLYDENVQLTAALAWSRLEQLAWVIAIVAIVAARVDAPTFRMHLVRAVRPGGARLGAWLVAAVAIAGGLVLHLHAGELGYSIDGDEIADALGGRLETEHFIIHYAHTPEIDADIQLIAADHEFRYAQDVATLGMAPAGKIESFYFADRDQKARWMGARDVEMAKPWRHEIYLDHRAFPHGSLRHEIAHVVASAFGSPWLRVSARRVFGMPLLVNPGLIEGLAVATDWPGGYDSMTPHESVRAMQAMGMTPTIGELLSLRFFSVSSARGYTTAGSFLKWLLDTYGAPKLRAVYENGGDFEAAYHLPRATLEQGWRDMIATIAVPPQAIEASRERFRGTSVFARPCPHAIAARREAAVAAYVAGDRPRAVDLMRHVCDDAPEEPRHRIELGDFLSTGDEAERAEASTLWSAVAADADGVTSSLRVEALERLARTAAANGDLATTTAIIHTALALPVDAGDRRQLEAEDLALRHDGPAGLALRGYFFGADKPLLPPTWALLATIAEPDLGFGFYLRGLQRTAAQDWAGSAADLAHALDLGLPDDLFVRNAARRLAVAAYRVHDTALVERAAAVLDRPTMLEVDRLLAADWRARLAFDRGAARH